MEPDQVIKIISPVITLLVGVLIKNYTEKKSNLVRYYGHVSSFNIKQAGNIPVNAHNIIIINKGRKSAFNVRIGHNYLPDDTKVYPPVNYEKVQSPDGSSEIIIPVLVSNEQVTISYLYFPPLTVDRINTYVKSDDGYAEYIDAMPSPPLSKATITANYLLVFIGASFIIYSVANFIKNII